MVGADLVLHVGFQQTGATMLQRALCRLRPQLRRHGVAFVEHSALTKLDSLAGWQCKKATDPEAIHAFERGVAELVDDEAAEVARERGGDVRTVVVSSDHLLGRQNINRRDGRPFRRFAVPGVAQVIRAFGASRVRLVLYVRRQDRLMEFCYLREVQKGRTHTFAQQFPHRFEALLNYHELCGRLASVPGVEDVRVRPFELVGSSASEHVEDFLSVLELNGQLDLAPVGTGLTPYRVYSRRALDIALDVNPFLESERERRLVRDFLIERFPGTDDTSTRFLPTHERARILDAYSRVNRQLFEYSMPDLPVDAYASDEATAQLGALRRPGADGDRPAASRGTHTPGAGDVATGGSPVGLRTALQRLRGHGAGAPRSVWSAARRRRRRATARGAWRQDRTRWSPRRS